MHSLGPLPADSRRLRPPPARQPSVGPREGSSSGRRRSRRCGTDASLRRAQAVRVRCSRSAAVGQRSRGSPHSKPARQTGRRGADASPPSAFAVARTHLIGEQVEFIVASGSNAKPLVHRIDRWWRTDLQKPGRKAIHALRDATSLPSAERPQARQRALRTLELILELRDRVIRRTAHEPNGTGRPRQQRNDADHESQRLARRPTAETSSGRIAATVGAHDEADSTLPSGCVPADPEARPLPVSPGLSPTWARGTG